MGQFLRGAGTNLLIDENVNDITFGDLLLVKEKEIITFAKTDPDRSLPPSGLYAMTEKPKQEPEILNPRYAGATPEAVVLALTRRKGKFEDFETERESENGRLF